MGSYGPIFILQLFLFGKCAKDGRISGKLQCKFYRVRHFEVLEIKTRRNSTSDKTESPAFHGPAGKPAIGRNYILKTLSFADFISQNHAVHLALFAKYEDLQRISCVKMLALIAFDTMESGEIIFLQ